MKRTVLLLSFFLFAGLYSKTHAQFEGQINFVIYNPQNVQEMTNLDMTFTRQRIFIESNSSMDVITGVRANGILVRNDYQDFVFMTGPNEALKIAKSDIDGLVNLMNRVQGKNPEEQRPPFNWDEKVAETGNKRSIHGYETTEFILQGDEENEYISVWLTDRIKINWGLLQETWHTTGAKQVGEEIPIELVMNRTSFPLLVEVYRDDNVVFRARSIEVKESGFDKSKTELSSNTKLLGFADLMMNMFRQRR
jgi:hypothetical protein